MRPLQAHCQLGLGQLHTQVNSVAKAQSELLAAVELYREMAMSFWLSKAETGLAKITQ
jgi:hypothetical protein